MIIPPKLIHFMILLKYNFKVALNNYIIKRFDELFIKYLLIIH